MFLFFPSELRCPGTTFFRLTAMSSNHAVSYQSSLRLLLALSDSALSIYEIVQPLTAPREHLFAVVC
jgi:hypothetical protein